MTSVIKNIFISVGASFIFIFLQTLLESEFINNFLRDNVITLLVALLAINLTTIGIVLSKIRDILELNNGSNFSDTRREMLLSVKEQIGLIIVASILLVVRYSTVYERLQIDNIFIDTALLSTFIYAILILYDTAKSVFIIIDLKNES